MKSLSLIVAAAASFGALALSGCSSCMPQMNQAAQDAKSAAAPKPRVTCGPDTIAQGNTCIGPVR